MTRPGQDRRPTLTLKGDQFTPEFRSLLNKAAKKAGTTQAAFAADVLAEAARRVLFGGGGSGGNPAGNPDDNPADHPVPVPVDQRKDLEDLRARQAKADERAEETAQQLRELSDQVRAMATRKGLLARVFGR